MICELCGSSGNLYVSVIEGVKLNVCGNCSKHGKVIFQVNSKNSKKSVRQIYGQKTDLIISDIILKTNFGDVIKEAREKINLKQQELAIKLSIKESLLRGIETNRIEPSIGLARKIEGFLGIKIIEEVKFDNSLSSKGKVDTLTIGDLFNKNK